MRVRDGQAVLSGTDLSSNFECQHKTVLGLRVAQRQLVRPGTSEIERLMLERRGRAHEEKVLEFFRGQGRDIVMLSSEPLTDESGHRLHAATVEAMRSGAQIIYQATFVQAGWVGRPDFLVRVNSPSQLGQFSYEPLDAKLARSERARGVLQLCFYADLLQGIQGLLPQKIWLALGHDDIEPLELRTGDYFHYYQGAKKRLGEFVSDPARREPYPEPCEFCDVCEWWRTCEQRRRKDDHLSLVAGITRRQRGKLEGAGVTQLVQLARLSDQHSVEGIEPGSLGKIRHQARLQEQGRDEHGPVYDLLTDQDPGTGLELLPLPKPGDLFLDLEGDAFLQDGGLEYLFGLLELGQPEFDFVSRQHAGEPRYLHYHATNRAEEKLAFEAVMDRIAQGLEEFPALHVYHFGHRENDALKKLSCRHATREELVDELLRRDVLVDLHRVVKQGLRASVEAYTLKELEALHGFARTVDRRESARAMQLFGWWLETRDPALNPDDLLTTLLQYNEEDCRSTWKLRDWLEARRPELEARLGRPLGRPVREETGPEKAPHERDVEKAELERRLRSDLPLDPAEDREEDAARRLLADLLNWHRRELKPAYWEYFEALKVPPSEWLESRFVLAGLEYERVVGTVARSEIHRYRFPDQEHGVGATPDPEEAGAKKTIKVVRIGPDFIDIKRGKQNRDAHPQALISGRPISSTTQERQLLALAKSVVHEGLEGGRSFLAGRALLLRRPPRCGQAVGDPLVREGEDTVAAVSRLTLALDHSVLAIQGPPGSGKTYRAARAILELVRAGKKVGVTANSHQVVLGVLKRVWAAAEEAKYPILMHHLAESDRFDEALPFPVGKDYAGVSARLAAGTLQVVGGTPFAWTRPEFENALDVLIVDEAGQISLANALAASTAAKSMVLVGDPAQLEQPQKGAHPPGAEISVLEHILGRSMTMPASQGVFLAETRRLHPSICAFTSSVFYEGRLVAHPGLERQRIDGIPGLEGAGPRYVRVMHEGNTNRSDEEVRVIAEIVQKLLSGSTFTSANGIVRPIEPRDILVVSPYNVQVRALKHRLASGVDIGTVDRFQGKEAPIVIYSMTTSTGDEAPRGLEFLYSLNRLNVATSRAQALVILVANPELTRARCRTPRHMQLVNALCGYLEAARDL